LLTSRPSSIYNGADDNAAGTCTLLGLSKSIKENQYKPGRTILFALVSGEEMGRRNYYMTACDFSNLDDVIQEFTKDEAHLFDYENMAGLVDHLISMVIWLSHSRKDIDWTDPFFRKIND